MIDAKDPTVSEEFIVRQENMIEPDPELYVMVMVRNKETGAIGIMALYNEAEVDKRVALLEEGLGKDDQHREVLDDLREFHCVRRESWKKIKDQIEIILPPNLR